MRHVANKLKMTLAALVSACMLLTGVPAVAFAAAGEAATDAVGSLGDAIESLAADDDAAQQAQTLATDYNDTTIVIEIPGSDNFRFMDLHLSKVESEVTVDWGDGTTETKSPKEDNGNLDFSRVDSNCYRYPGTYTIVISSSGTYCLGYGTTSDYPLTSSSSYVTSIRAASNATPQTYSFYGCSSATTIDISRCDTTQVTDMSYMFYDCSSLTSLNLSSLDTSQVTDMSYMFYDCSSLTSLNLSSLDTSQVTDMSYMFYNCKKLANISLASFDTAHVTDMSWMFHYCSSLTALDLSGFDTSRVTDMSYMFWYCEDLISADLSGFDTTQVTDMKYMFCRCTKLTTLDISSFNTSAVVDMTNMFYLCSNLTSLNLASLNTSNVKSMHGMFYHCVSLPTLDVSSFNTSKVEDMCGMFCWCTGLTSIDCSSFNTSKVTDTSYMFSICTSLTTFDASGFDATQITDMSYMFADCTDLTYANLTGFCAQKAAYMEGLFDQCSSLESVDLSGFDTSSVTDMSSMFRYCSSLTSLDLTSFDTSSVTSTEYMFFYCSSLSALDLANFDTAQVTYMSHMFGFCASLSSLDLSSFNTTQINSNSGMYNVFQGCNSLRKIVLGSGFAFVGSSGFKCTLPSSLSLSYETTNRWVEITTGQVYSYNAVPDGAGTYYAQAATSDTQTLPLTMSEDEFQVSAVYNGYRVIPQIDTDYLDVTEYSYTCSDIQETDGTKTVKVTITSAGNYATEESTYTFEYEVVCEEVEPTYDASPTPTAIYGDTLEKVTLPESELGTWAWSDKTESVGDAGRSYHEATFTPNAGTEIDGVEGPVTVLLGIKVSPRPITEVATVSVAADAAYIYTGSAIEPAVTVTPQSGYSLSAGTDYTLRYYNNTNVGTATATIIGCGNYTGRTSATFTIGPIAIGKDLFSIDLSVEPYTGSAVTKEITSDILRKSDYTVAYTDNVKIGTATITITGKNNCSDGTLTYTFQIAGGKIDSTLFDVDTDPVTYAGEEITKEVSSTAGLFEGSDYTVTYGNNVDVGTASIYIEGTGIYSGSLRYTFRITALSVAEDDFSVDESAKTYTGLPITAKITAAEPLVEDRDYTVTYTDNTEVGTATLVIRCDGKNCTGGPFTYSFYITSLRITTGLFSVDTSTVAYTGKEITKKIVAPAGLEEGRDYIVTYANNREIGSATINIIGINNCYGTAIYTFKIVDPTSLKAGGSKLHAQKIKLAKKKVSVKRSGKKVKVKVKGAKTKLVAKPKNKKAKKALKIKVKGKKKLIVKAKPNAKRGTYQVKVYAKQAGYYSKSKTVKLKVKVK